MRRLTVRSKILGAISGLVLMAMPVFVSAHHSSALFDQSRSLTLQGVIKEFRWTNPHASIQVAIKGKEGRDEQWNVEMSSPEVLARAGWKPSTLRTGDAVSLVVHPMRDDTKAGYYVSGTGPRGALINDPAPASVSSQTLSPLEGTSCAPRVDLTVIESSASSETRPVQQGERTLFVRRNAITTTRDIAEINVLGDDFDTLVRIKYTPEAAARLHDATTGHDGLALAFVVDDDVWLAFVWQGPYGIGPEGTQLSIRNGLAKAQRLVESIRGCTDTQTR